MTWRKFIILLFVILACLAMKKTSDEELNQWRYDQKRAPVSLSILGDPATAYSHMGEAKSLLWSVKNALSLNKQMQGEGERRLSDGSTIRVKCVFGFDIVEIDASKSKLAPEAVLPSSCSITFINLPVSVPPMKNPVSAMNVGIVSATDVQGVDYFKTYYSVDVRNCPTCQEIAWDLTFKYAVPTESRYFHNSFSIPQMGVDPGKDDPTNHMIYSGSFPCYAEIISHGEDASGTFIIWKAYTETPILGTAYSRTGLGIMLISAFILDSSGTTLCSQQKKLDVDCCLKNPELRKVEIWWESVHGCEPFMIYLDKHICKMPAIVQIAGSSGLIAYSTPFYAAQPLYSIFEIKGSCLPVEWIFDGPIILFNSNKNDPTIYFQITAADCHKPVTITLRDRCGTQDVVHGSPCCDDCAPLSIGYTSLLMGCSQSQDLIAIGGCAPYYWSVSSGSISPPSGQTTTYISPPSNGNCVNNPTITLTDCCGNVATVKFAVSCYSAGGTAFEISESLLCGCLACNAYPCDFCSPPCMGRKTQYRNRQYNCDGTLTSDCKAGGGWGCEGYYNLYCLNSCASCIPDSGCNTMECGGGPPCGELKDVRSDAFKAGGCCPLNPLTGLPYD